jgi:hypothetical protein
MPPANVENCTKPVGAKLFDMIFVSEDSDDDDDDDEGLADWA